MCAMDDSTSQSTEKQRKEDNHQTARRAHSTPLSVKETDRLDMDVMGGASRHTKREERREESARQDTQNKSISERRFLLSV